MRIKRAFPLVLVTKKAENSIRRGHPWVYFDEITDTFGAVENGGIADVVSDKGTYLGSGLYSAHSKIRVRLLSSNANDKFDAAFFARRLRYAIDCRRSVMGGDFSACRLVFGEADGLPGLTVDRFNDVCVTQVLSYGMNMRREILYGALRDILAEYGVPLRGIYERNDVSLREQEGLAQYKGWYQPETVADTTTSTEITENGVRYLVDFENGQKSGFFLAQKYNRLAVARMARDRRVLDCFTHTGSFALNAAAGGAAHVTAVDVSQTALDCAAENARRNGFADRIDFLCADVFDLLPSLAEKGEKPYDFIILDPPAFTKSRRTVRSAERGYKEINYRAMKLLPRGGYLATCSCSHFMPNELFAHMLRDAASDAGVQLRQLEARQQCCDHPILWNVPETDYLKFYLFQIV